ncbi:AbrB/MazE/SpoVT family DNA-binding domain-containing protein [Halorussus marinus]|uniref:AbrB/MazE/SpoVT family DNA-binding domain-containing protein n=1 Tax=Halorussus marinus TaxID=2505976 RepID=UPI00106E94D8|nr:AbrB/MazE/SpoVT family DNA-binding domain-containing protein [Halorussus marinus]
MPRTTVTTTTYTGEDGHKRTQYRTTIPKQLAETFDMEDTELEWKMGGASDKLEIQIIEE